MERGSHITNFRKNHPHVCTYMYTRTSVDNFLAEGFSCGHERGVVTEPLGFHQFDPIKSCLTLESTSFLERDPSYSDLSSAFRTFQSRNRTKLSSKIFPSEWFVQSCFG